MRSNTFCSWEIYWQGFKHQIVNYCKNAYPPGKKMFLFSKGWKKKLGTSVRIYSIPGAQWEGWLVGWKDGGNFLPVIDYFVPLSSAFYFTQSQLFSPSRPSLLSNHFRSRLVSPYRLLKSIRSTFGLVLTSESIKLINQSKFAAQRILVAALIVL